MFLRLFTSILLLLGAVFFSPSYSFAYAPTLVVQTSDYMKIKENFNQLKQNNERLEKISTEQEKQLKEARMQLEKAMKELETSKEELMKAKTSNEIAEDSLKRLKASLKKSRERMVGVGAANYKGKVIPVGSLRYHNVEVIAGDGIIIGLYHIV